jgi:shikimate kinase
MNKIVLTGYMASGKTTIGQLLSQASGLKYLDLDELIEEIEGKDINTIFIDKGEIYFRKLEHRVLKDILNKDEEFVLSLGGGTPCYANNHLLLQDENIISVYLKASVKELLSRLKNERQQRPLLANVSGDELEEFIAKHLFDRAFYYHHAKHIVLVDGKLPDIIVNEIMSLF